jgi:hypothetical protein
MLDTLFNLFCLHSLITRFSTSRSPVVIDTIFGELTQEELSEIIVKLTFSVVILSICLTILLTCVCCSGSNRSSTDYIIVQEENIE